MAKAKQWQNEGKSKDETMAKRRQSKNKTKAKQRQSKCEATYYTILGQVGAILGPPWDILGHLDRFSGFVGTILEQSWPILAQLAPSWEPFGPTEAYPGVFEAILGHLEGSLGLFEAILGLSWVI